MRVRGGSSSLSTRTGTTSQEDRRSVISGGSSATSTLVADSVASSRLSNATSQLRKFTAGVGRPGLAREAREAARNVITSANPTRKPPLSAPLDYEKFVQEKSIYLDNDPQRDLLHFPRDDIQQTLIQPEPATEHSSVSVEDINKARWLLTKEALRLYSAPYSTITLNYAKFAGDYTCVNDTSSTEVDVALSSLVFESDMALEEEKAALEGFLLSDVIKEGWLSVVKTDSSTLLDNFKAEKRRYCVLKRTDGGDIEFALLKAPGAAASKPSIRVNSAQLKSTKKGKTVLEVEPFCADDSAGDSREKSLMLAAESTPELSAWLHAINRAIAIANKVDTISHSSEKVEKKTSPQELLLPGDNDSVHSEDSASTSSSGREWRGRTSAARALQPPIVDRRNIFSLYHQLMPFAEPKGEPFSLLDKSTRCRHFSSTSTANSSLGAVSPQKGSAHGPRVTVCESSPPTRFLVEFRRLDLRLPISNTQVVQIEPFFVRLFVFDANSGRRVSEEFHVDVNDDSLNAMWRLGRDTVDAMLADDINGVSRILLTSASATRALCTVSSPHRDMWVVVRVDRILQQDVQGEPYVKNTGDIKASLKLQKMVQSACSRLGAYRTRFAWTARPIFADARSGDLSARSAPEALPLFRCENNRLTEQELTKFLLDYSKLEKTSKLLIPGASVTVRVDVQTKLNDHPFRVSSSLLPLRPWKSPRDSPVPPVFELQSFADTSDDPHSDLVNLLYVYPQTLRYDNQKVFSKARNISCTVRFVRGSDQSVTGIQKQAVFDRLAPGGPFLGCGSCCVQHHQQCPSFCEEIKMRLPLSLDPYDHILFTFAHVSVAGHSNPKSPPESVETHVGFAWLPLVGRKDRLTLESDEQEFSLPVAAELPPNYFRCRPLGLGKGDEGPEIRWVDQKPLFRVRVRLVSSTFTTEPKIHSFFQACQKLEAIGVVGDAAQLTKSPSSLDEAHRSCSPLARSPSLDEEDPIIKELIFRTQVICEVATNKLIPFLPIALNRLFALLPAAPTSQMAVTTLSAIVTICDRVSHANKKSLLRSFVRLHFSGKSSERTTHVGARNHQDESTHTSIMRHLPALVNSASRDSDALAALYRQMWFLLNVALKSIAQAVIRNSLYKCPRSERFSPELLESVGAAIEATVPQYIAKHRELPEESRLCNNAVANFLRGCVSLLDRGAVFRWVYFVVQNLDEGDSRILREYKWDLLCVFCQHEHWLPLCLPILIDSNESIQRINYQTSIQEPTVANAASTGSFLSRFINQLFHAPSISELNETERYSLCANEWRLSANYCMWHFPIGLLLQELWFCLREPRDYRKRVIALLRNLLAKHSMDPRYADTNMQRRVAVLYAPLTRFALDHTAELEAAVMGDRGDSSMAPQSQVNWTSYGSGQAENGLLAASKWRSLDRRTSAIGGVTAGPLGSGGTRPAPPLPPVCAEGTPRKDSTLPSIAPLAEKLDLDEVQDVLLSVLWVVYRIPKRILRLLWSESDAERAPQWLRLMELALDVFQYRGRQHAINVTTPIIRGSRPMLLHPPSSSSSGRHLSVDFSGVSEGSTDDSVSSIPIPFGVLQVLNLSQEVAIIILDTLQTFAQQLASKQAQKLSVWDEVFCRLLSIHVSLLDEHWPEAVRLHTFAALAVFINLFRVRLFETGPLDALSLLIERLLTQMASRLSSVQSAAAALLQFILRAGYETAQTAIANEALSHSVSPSSAVNGHRRVLSAAERLGRPGAQTGVALARLLGSHKGMTGSARFERGLVALECLVNVEPRKMSSFEKAVLELIGQLRGVLSATGALKLAADDPIRLADLHIQLADSYRGSAALRSAWFDTLAEAHSSAGWHAESAVCHAHSAAIIGKELLNNGVLTNVDWSVLDWVSSSVAEDEGVRLETTEIVHPAGFTLENLALKIEKTARELTLAERFEAVGPLYRLLIPALETNNNFNSLRSVYAELNQTSSRALEAHTSGRRHLGAYFRVLFLGRIHFGSEHDTEWVYREAGLTSLAEASTRIRDFVRQRLGHDRVRIEPEAELDVSTFDPQYAHIQITHVEPLCEEKSDKGAFQTHTNISEFVYESPVIEGGSEAMKKAPAIQDQALKRTILTVHGVFPGARRRLRVCGRREQTFSPLEFACQKLRTKARQIRAVVDAGCEGRPLDVKGLQLLLQGAVMPTVNAGPLAYAEAFTQPYQRERYGSEGLKELEDAFRELMSCCESALQANAAAIGQDQQTYHEVLVSSAEAMVERLVVYFGPEFNETQEDKAVEPSRSSFHILDSIGGIRA